MDYIKKGIVFLCHLIMVFLLTITSQVGGLIWMVVFMVFAGLKKKFSIWIQLLTFVIIYLVFIFTALPMIAKSYGKVPLPRSEAGNLIPHHALYYLFNRNYATPDTKAELIKIANEIHKKDPNLKLVYLDASWPIGTEIPLLPHISHSNGRKVDLCFAYKKDGQYVDYGNSTTGYGNFIPPQQGESDLPGHCLSRGKHLYDFAKYLQLGKKEIEFDITGTKLIMDELCKSDKMIRIFLETHLVERLDLQDKRVRAAGCWAVRHDDHIHFQMR